MHHGSNIHRVIALLAVVLMRAAMATAGPDEHIGVQFSALGAIPALQSVYATTAHPASIDVIGSGLFVAGFAPSSSSGNMQFVMFDSGANAIIKEISLPAAPFYYRVMPSPDGSAFTISYGFEDARSCVVSRSGEVLLEAPEILLAAADDLVGLTEDEMGPARPDLLDKAIARKLFPASKPWAACGFGPETGVLVYLSRDIVAFNCGPNGSKNLVIYDNSCRELWKTPWAFGMSVAIEGGFGGHRAFVLNRGIKGAEIVDELTGDVLHTMATNVSAPALSANALYYAASEGEHNDRGNLVYYIYCVDGGTGRAIRIESYMGLAPESIRVTDGLVVAVIGENSWETQAHTVVYSKDLRKATSMEGHWAVSAVDGARVSFVGAASGGPGLGVFSVDVSSLFSAN